MTKYNNTLIGCALAFLAAIMWGTIPIAVAKIIVTMSPITVVWYRFILSSIVLFLIMKGTHQLPCRKALMNRSVIMLLILAVVALCANFILYSTSLLYVSPSITQLVAQLSSVGLIIASLIIFKERLNGIQISGFAILLMGLLLFFNRGLIEIFTQLTAYSKGVLLAFSAAMVWVIYGLCQKVLLKNLKAQQILLMIYFGCIVLIFPFVTMNEIFELTAYQLALLIYCGLNTIISYGALAEAMNRWQVSQVSAVITLTPLFTLIFSDLLALIWPEIFLFPSLNLLGYLGAIIVVLGTMIMVSGPIILKRILRERPKK